MSAGAAFQLAIGLLLNLNWAGRMEAGARVYTEAAYDMALAVPPLSQPLALVAGQFLRET